MTESATAQTPAGIGSTNGDLTLVSGAIDSDDGITYAAAELNDVLYTAFYEIGPMNTGVTLDRESQAVVSVIFNRLTMIYKTRNYLKAYIIPSKHAFNGGNVTTTSEMQAITQRIAALNKEFNACPTQEGRDRVAAKIAECRKEHNEIERIWQTQKRLKNAAASWVAENVRSSSVITLSQIITAPKQFAGSLAKGKARFQNYNAGRNGERVVENRNTWEKVKKTVAELGRTPSKRLMYYGLRTKGQETADNASEWETIGGNSFFAVPKLDDVNGQPYSQGRIDTLLKASDVTFKRLWLAETKADSLGIFTLSPNWGEVDNPPPYCLKPNEAVQKAYYNPEYIYHVFVKLHQSSERVTRGSAS